MQLTSIDRYPVKSCRGTTSDAAAVEPWGLAGDRRWMVVDADGDVITAREAPRLLLAVPTVTATGLHVTAPDLPELDVTVPDGAAVAVHVWHSTVDAVPADDETNAWFAALTGREARLVHLADPTQRQTNDRFGAAGDRVSFADGYPLLVATTASLDALNDAVLEGPRADEGPLPMTRFRPNLVVGGAEPWAEDGWRRLRVGDAVFRAVKGCARCVMTTFDPWDVSKGKEPIATLARIRRFDGATWFGMNLIPDTPGAVISAGDEVEILEAVAAPDGPPR